jgi:hypothetical protein
MNGSSKKTEKIMLEVYSERRNIGEVREWKAAGLTVQTSMGNGLSDAGGIGCRL